MFVLLLVDSVSLVCIGITRLLGLLLWLGLGELVVGVVGVCCVCCGCVFGCFYFDILYYVLLVICLVSEIGGLFVGGFRCLVWFGCCFEFYCVCLCVVLCGLGLGYCYGFDDCVLDVWLVCCCGLVV